MIGSWNLENLLVYAVNIQTFPLSVGTQTYTLGFNSSFIGSISGTSLTTTTVPTTPLAIGQQITGIPGLTGNTMVFISGGSGTSWTLSFNCGTVPSQTFGNCVGNNFSVPRPARVQRCSIQYSTSSPLPIELAIPIVNLDQWQSTTVKQVTSAFPTLMYNDTNFPSMNLYFWPVPSTACNVILYTWDMLSEASNYNQTIEVPQGYNEALKYNLAIRLAPYYDREPSATIVKMAIASKANINDINNGIPIMSFDAAWQRSRGYSEGLKSRGFFVP